MNELWRPIKGYDGDYLVSNFGRVKSFKYKNPKILKPGIDKDGYYKITLCKNNYLKTHKAHRLVGKAFIPNPENKAEINHKNGRKNDNNVANLEWVTPKENSQHAWQTGLKENVRKKLIIVYEANKTPVFSSKLNMQFNSIVDAATYLQSNYFENTTLICLRTSIFNLLNNKVTKSKYDYGWEYIDKIKINDI